MDRPTEVNASGLYLEPTTFCPLDCGLCYTAHHRRDRLPFDVARRAVEVMLDGVEVLGLFWCGLGEVYADPRFPGFLDRLDGAHGPRLLHLVQTNGQHPRRAPARRPENKVFLLSMDLPRAFHESHRGPGTWERAVAFGARQLEAGVLGVGVKSLVTLATIPQLAGAFAALQATWSRRTGLPLAEVQARTHLEPVVPFPPRDTAQVGGSAFVARGAAEDPEVLYGAVARHLPHLALHRRPRTVQLSVTVDGVFSCCEAVVRVGDHADLRRLDRRAWLDRLEAAAEACGTCPLRGVC